jgi:hypothetical protein
MTSIRIASRWRRRRLVNETMNAYVRWREQCSAVWVAYSYWAVAPPADAGLWYRAYAVALDREQRACEVYAGLIRRAGHHLIAADFELAEWAETAAVRPRFLRASGQRLKLA